MKKNKRTLDIEQICRKNPLVDKKLLKASHKQLKLLKVRRAEYNLTIPFTRSIQSSN
jgi:hypothetical protein